MSGIQVLVLANPPISAVRSSSWWDLIDGQERLLDGVDVLVGISPFEAAVTAPIVHGLADCPDVLCEDDYEDALTGEVTKTKYVSFLRSQALQEWLKSGKRTLLLLPILEPEFEETIPDDCMDPGPARMVWHRDPGVAWWVEHVAQAALWIEEKSYEQPKQGATLSPLAPLGDVWTDSFDEFVAPIRLARKPHKADAEGVQVWQRFPNAPPFTGCVATGRLGEGAYFLCHLWDSASTTRSSPSMELVLPKPYGNVTDDRPAVRRLAERLSRSLVEIAASVHVWAHREQQRQVDFVSAAPLEVPGKSDNTPEARADWIFEPDGDAYPPNSVRIPGVGLVRCSHAAGGFLKALWKANKDNDFPSDGQLVEYATLISAIDRLGGGTEIAVHKARDAAKSALTKCGVPAEWVKTHITNQRGSGYRLDLSES